MTAICYLVARNSCLPWRSKQIGSVWDNVVTAVARERLKFFFFSRVTLFLWQIPTGRLHPRFRTLRNTHNGEICTNDRSVFEIVPHLDLESADDFNRSSDRPTESLPIVENEAGEIQVSFTNSALYFIW